MPDGTSNRATKKVATKKSATKKSAKQKKAERSVAINKRHRAAFVRAMEARYKRLRYEPMPDEVREQSEATFDMTHAAVFAAIPGKQNTLTGEKAMDAAVKAVCAVVRKQP